MADFNTRELRVWALKGAEQRLVEIAAEAAAIHQTFPELRDRAKAGMSHGRAAGQERSQSDSTPARRKGRRRRMSPEGRTRIAEAARRRWAAWKANKNDEAEAAATSAAPSAGRAPKKR